MVGFGTASCCLGVPQLVLTTINIQLRDVDQLTAWDAAIYVTEPPLKEHQHIICLYPNELPQVVALPTGIAPPRQLAFWKNCERFDETRSQFRRPRGRREAAGRITREMYSSHVRRPNETQASAFSTYELMS
ncbi:MAG: hypothetical protein M1813_003615 [Trichoglossum hirsutum]|nr:MAG: hypothetical protein M1813_003615 [Trichoglossum hirsutum]